MLSPTQSVSSVGSASCGVTVAATGAFTARMPSVTHCRWNRCIVELIGPPGAGKTTLALAAAAGLERYGLHPLRAISARPGELPSASEPKSLRQRGGATALARAAKLFGALAGAPRGEPVSEGLLRLMPLPGRLTALRRHRYLGGLAAAPVDGLWLRDQGYVCAIAGLALDSGCDGERTLAEALELVPLPDIIVRVDTPLDIAGARLRQRFSRQSRAERMFERAPDDNPRLTAILDTLETLLTRRGRCLLHVCGRDRAGLEAGVSAIVVAVQAHRTAGAVRR